MVSNYYQKIASNSRYLVQVDNNDWKQSYSYYYSKQKKLFTINNLRKSPYIVSGFNIAWNGAFLIYSPHLSGK